MHERRRQSREGTYPTATLTCTELAGAPFRCPDIRRRGRWPARPSGFLRKAGKPPKAAGRNVPSSRAGSSCTNRDTLQRPRNLLRIADRIRLCPQQVPASAALGKSYARIVADVTPELKAKATETAHDLGIGVSAYLEWLLRRDSPHSSTRWINRVGSTTSSPSTPNSANSRRPTRGRTPQRRHKTPEKTKPAPICLAARAGIVPKTIGGPTIPGPRRGSGRGCPRVTRDGQSTTPTHASSARRRLYFPGWRSEWLTADDPPPDVAVAASQQSRQRSLLLGATRSCSMLCLPSTRKTWVLRCGRCCSTTDAPAAARSAATAAPTAAATAPRKGPRDPRQLSAQISWGTHAAAARLSDFTGDTAVGTRPRRRSARDCARIGLGSCAEPRDRLPARRNQDLDTRGPVPTWTRPSISRIHRAQ